MLPDQKAWQIFDSKVTNLLYDEYHFKEAHFEEAVSIEALIKRMPGLDQNNALKTIKEFNEACCPTDAFDPTALDGLSTTGLSLPKSNWSQPLDTPPFRAYPVTGGITFTYGGLKVSPDGAVMKNSTDAIKGLFACGELVGGVFYNGYPGGSGLTSGLVFGRRAGYGAASFS